MGEIILDDAANWLSRRRAHSIDNFVFDMPYAHAYARNAFCDKFSGPGLETWVTGWATEAYRAARDGAWLVTTTTGMESKLARVLMGLENAGWATDYPLMLWAHPAGFTPSPRQPDGSRKGYYPNPQYDPIVLASKGKAVSWMDRLRFLGRTPGTVAVSGGLQIGPYYEFDRWQPFPMIDVPKARRDEVDYGLYDLPIRQMYSSGVYAISPRHNCHESVKPLKLFLYLLKLFTNVNDIIVDPFVGSGTTIIACDMLARRGIGIEIDAVYYDVARRRVAAWARRVSAAGVTPRMKRLA